MGSLETSAASLLTAGFDGAPAAHDFVNGALGECWVASVAYSQAILVSMDKFTGNQPATAADFFDLARFPGARAMKQGAKLNLELALLADGVPPQDIYKTL